MPRQSTARCGRCRRTGHNAKKCHALLCDYCDKVGHMEDERRILMRHNESGQRTVSQIIECLICSQNSKKDTRHKSQGQCRENLTIIRERCNANCNTKDIDEFTIGHYRSKLMSSYKNIVEIKAPELKRRRAKMLIDTASAVTLIKIGNLLNKVRADEEILTLESAIGRIQTICLIELNIRVGGEIVTHPCRVVHDDFYVETDGVLGWDFICKSRINADYIELYGVRLPLLVNELVRRTLRNGAITVVTESRSDSESG